MENKFFLFFGIIFCVVVISFYIYNKFFKNKIIDDYPDSNYTDTQSFNMISEEKENCKNETSGQEKEMYENIKIQENETLQYEEIEEIESTHETLDDKLELFKILSSRGQKKEAMILFNSLNLNTPFKKDWKDNPYLNCLVQNVTSEIENNPEEKTFIINDFKNIFNEKFSEYSFPMELDFMI